jgi:hypothetical protein
VLPFVYSLAMCIWASLSFKPNDWPTKNGSLINLLPIITCIADWIEGLGLVTMLQVYPGTYACRRTMLVSFSHLPLIVIERSNGMAQLTSISTMVKWSSAWILILPMLFVAILSCNTSPSSRCLYFFPF